MTAAEADWAPARAYDLITCVHGLHYLGDQLGAIARAAGRLVPDGRFAAHFDPESVRRADGSSAARPVLAALRAAGFEYRARRHLLVLDGARAVRLPFEYLGADPTAGPDRALSGRSCRARDDRPDRAYTGQSAVASYYRASSDLPVESDGR
ncbi:hypothetical protein [Kitasatospora sp. NPDC058218]|uniref:hypothetical protein n=1 Tax=Kitasatospora sp. NPDC058218 TaxID=3346385 RepID=UPI0036DB9E62